MDLTAEQDQQVLRGSSASARPPGCFAGAVQDGGHDSSVPLCPRGGGVAHSSREKAAALTIAASECSHPADPAEHIQEADRQEAPHIGVTVLPRKEEACPRYPSTIPLAMPGGLLSQPEALTG
jgi:hypothetical protein